jgi:hypothetical protein
MTPLVEQQRAVHIISQIPTPHIINLYIFSILSLFWDRLCGLVVRVLVYRSGGLGSIPGTTRNKM